MKAIYPGSFDPLTYGHLDIIKRAAKIFDSIEVLVSDNPDKTHKLDVADRIRLIEESTKGLDNISARAFSGLTVEYAKDNGFDVILRSIRGASDFETELEMSQINYKLSDGIETMFLMTTPEHSFIRSSRVWELVKYDADISDMVPENVQSFIESRAFSSLH